ncbi:MAG: NTP transferase domain-containing protein, partial [Pseudomonadota bacterium]
MTDLHLIVLAAGQGTRMKSTMPKVLHPVAHKPMVHHVLAVAEACKAASVTGVVSPGMPAIEAAFGEHKLAVQQQALGTGDAVKAGLSAIPEDASGIAVVLYADTPLVRQETVEALVKPIIDGQAAVTFFAMRVDEPGAYGRMVTDADGALLRITEAREADEATLAINLCNGGFCAFDLGKARGLVHQIDNQNNKGEYYVTDLVEIARDAGHGVHAVEGDPTDAMGVNDRADLALVEAAMQKRLRTHHML